MEGFNSDIQRKGSDARIMDLEPGRRYFDHDGLRLHYWEWGDPKEETYVFVHGVRDQGRSWDHFLEALLKRGVPIQHAVALDLRGHARKGADVIIAQGYEAGGHTGTIGNFPLIPQIVDAVRPKPVVAAGGISDGRGVAAALALGAVGVWCGTTFLVTQEGGINPIYKKQILNGTSEDFVRTAYTSGHFARHYRSDVIKAWMSSGLEAMPTPYQGNAMDEVRRAAEAANRVDLLHGRVSRLTVLSQLE